MLVANVCAARYLDKREVPAIHRVHEAPREDEIKKLERMVHNFGGGEGRFSGGKLQKKISRVLQSFEGKVEGEALNILTLRAMSQARYSPENLGHFGLGFSHYAHFTSPIRRYPDLITHRLIKHFVADKKRYPLASLEKLEVAGSWLSGCEQKSVKAERQFQSIKAARFMQGKLGEKFTGVISSVAKFGVFVVLREYDVHGLIKIENLGPRGLEFDEENLWLVSPKSGLRYKIGDKLDIIVEHADANDGKIDFVLAEEPVNANSDNRKENRSDSKKRRKTKKNRRGSGRSRVSQSRRKD